jgi:hypothetical protein
VHVCLCVYLYVCDSTLTRSLLVCSRKFLLNAYVCPLNTPFSCRMPNFFSLTNSPAFWQAFSQSGLTTHRQVSAARSDFSVRIPGGAMQCVACVQSSVTPPPSARRVAPCSSVQAVVKSGPRGSSSVCMSVCVFVCVRVLGAAA